MTGNEKKAYGVIAKDGKVHLQRIARNLKVSSDYARLICQGLERAKLIRLMGGWAVIPAFAGTELVEEHNSANSPLAQLAGINEELQKTLEGAGYASLADLAHAPISKLMSAARLNVQTAASLINQARESIGEVKTG